MRLLTIAVLVWLLSIVAVGILLRDSPIRSRAMAATAGAAAGSLIVLYCSVRKRTERNS